MDAAPLLPTTAPPPPPPPLPARSFLYPLTGILTFLRSPHLHPPLRTRILPLTLLSLLTLLLLFPLLYLPHLLILRALRDPFPAWTATLMILSEAAALITFLAESFLTEHQIVDTFDLYLLHASCPPPVQRKLRYQLSRAREPRADGAPLGKHKLDPLLKLKESFRTGVYCLLALPLNLIPVVGWPLFLVAQARVLGPLAHYRWFQLLGWGEERRAEYVRRNRWRYWGFGLAHVGLQLLPGVGIVFLFTSAVGAAEWALEAERRLWVAEGARGDWGVEGRGVGRLEVQPAGRGWWRVWPFGGRK